ncbi:MAG: hypothetical protein M1818_004847 [Claussenomyces sp. TS43310]|nr:MAG: hypothetical protein M1818_004847 [Claussenomyces sp. TS43310]
MSASCTGSTTRSALDLLPVALPTPSEARIRFLIIFFGANDAVLPPVSLNPQHVPLPIFFQTVHALVSHPLVTAHSPHILLITPPPIEETVIAQNAADYGETRVKRLATNTALYAQAVRRVGIETGTVVVDLWTAFMNKAGYNPDDPEEAMPGTKEGGLNETLRGLLVDGLHLTPAGYMILFEEVMETIEKVWPEELPDKLPSLKG